MCAAGGLNLFTHAAIDAVLHKNEIIGGKNKANLVLKFQINKYIFRILLLKNKAIKKSYKST